MSNALRLTGATRLYAIIGDPIAQVLSPEVFTDQFRLAGVDAVLVPVHVPEPKFHTIIPALLALGNLDGVIVTVPFKARMVPFATRVSAVARTVEAINVLRREPDGAWTGDMFDGAGFVRAAERKGGRVRGRRVLLFGAGGAGSAIACALASAGVQSIRIADPDAARVQGLISRLGSASPECDLAHAGNDCGDVDMVVNASPIGMHPEDGMPGAVGLLTSGTLVGDVVVTDAPTALIRRALQHGCACVNGRDMHAAQVELIMGFFSSAWRTPETGPRPPASAQAIPGERVADDGRA